MKRASQLLFYKRHREAGVKGWELRRKLGSDYPKVLQLLNEYLEKIDLNIKTVFEDHRSSIENPSLAELDKAKFYVTIKGSQTIGDEKMLGWRIDDLAGLAISLGFIISKREKCSRKDLIDLLRNKLPNWRVDLNLKRYFRAGYLVEDENGLISIGWRTRAEVDQKELIDMYMTTKK